MSGFVFKILALAVFLLTAANLFADDGAVREVVIVGRTTLPRDQVRAQLSTNFGRVECKDAPPAFCSATLRRAAQSARLILSAPGYADYERIIPLRLYNAKESVVFDLGSVTLEPSDEPEVIQITEASDASADHFELTVDNPGNAPAFLSQIEMAAALRAPRGVECMSSSRALIVIDHTLTAQPGPDGGVDVAGSYQRSDGLHVNIAGEIEYRDCPFFARLRVSMPVAITLAPHAQATVSVVIPQRLKLRPVGLSQELTAQARRFGDVSQFKTIGFSLAARLSPRRSITIYAQMTRPLKVSGARIQR